MLTAERSATRISVSRALQASLPREPYVQLLYQAASLSFRVCATVMRSKCMSGELGAFQRANPGEMRRIAWFFPLRPTTAQWRVLHPRCKNQSEKVRHRSPGGTHVTLNRGEVRQSLCCGGNRRVVRRSVGARLRHADQHSAQSVQIHL